MKTIKYQTQTVTISVANYAADHTEVEEIQLDKTYDRVTGVAVHVLNDSGAANTNYQLGLANDIGDLHELTHVGGWATGKADGTSPNERFKDFNFEIQGGGLVQCKVKLPAQNLATALSVQFVFRIEKDFKRTN